MMYHLLLAVLFMIMMPQALNAAELLVCVKKNGSMYLVGEAYSRSECRPRDTEMALNTIGPQGPKGDKGDKGDVGLQGPQGEAATHGAGNAAFVHENFVLKTDGTVWILNSGNVPFSPSAIGPVPIPVEDILDWRKFSFIDTAGNVWYFEAGSPQLGWRNFGPVP